MRHRTASMSVRSVSGSAAGVCVAEKWASTSRLTDASSGTASSETASSGTASSGTASSGSADWDQSATGTASEHDSVTYARAIPPISPVIRAMRLGTPSVDRCTARSAWERADSPYANLTPGRSSRHMTHVRGAGTAALETQPSRASMALWYSVCSSDGGQTHTRM